jgi:antitoxin FitA
MGVNISIKNVPAEKVEQLKQRAKLNHRSLQGELMALIDQATTAVPKQTMTIEELSKYVRSLGLTTGDEAVQMIREDRDVNEEPRKLTIDEAVAKIRKLGLSRHNEAVRMIREDRDR